MASDKAEFAKSRNLCRTTFTTMLLPPATNEVGTMAREGEGVLEGEEEAAAAVEEVVAEGVVINSGETRTRLVIGVIRLTKTGCPTIWLDLRQMREGEVEAEAAVGA